MMFDLQLPFNTKSQSHYFNFQICTYYTYISVYTQITLRWSQLLLETTSQSHCFNFQVCDCYSFISVYIPLHRCNAYCNCIVSLITSGAFRQLS